MYSLVNHTKWYGSGSSTNSPTISGTGADLIIWSISCNGGSNPAFGDNLGNTYSLAERSPATTGHNISLQYVQAPTVSSSMVFSLTTGGGFPSVAVGLFSGSATSPLDQVGNSATATSASITPTVNNELIVCGETDGGGSGTYTSSGFSISDFLVYQSGFNYGGGLSYLIQGTAAGISTTWTNGGAGTTETAIASFKAAAGGPAFIPPPPYIINQSINRAGTY